VGWLIDFAILFATGLFFGIVAVIAAIASHGLAVAIEVLGGLAGLGLQIWFAVQIGQTGQSPGMRVAGLKAVKADFPDQTIGVGAGIVRFIVVVVLGWLCFVPLILNYLFPLWDQRKQTIADKAGSDVVIRTAKQGFSLTPPTRPAY
jgi:uncharacterized RDD family membrane protein YckC